MATPDERAAEGIGRGLEGRILALQRERALLFPAAAAARMLDIDAEIAVLQAEKARIDPRRPPRQLGPVTIGGTVADIPPTRIR